MYDFKLYVDRLRLFWDQITVIENILLYIISYSIDMLASVL